MLFSQFDGEEPTLVPTASSRQRDQTIIEYERADLPAGQWAVGTLTYTRRGLAILFSWLLWGDFAWNMKERAINPIAQLMLRRFTAPDWLVGLIVGSIPSAIGLVLGPIISVKSDRHRGRWGRRIPFILVPTPIVVLTMVGVAMTPQIGDWLSHHVRGHHLSQTTCRIAVFTLFWTVLEIATIVANSLVAALVNDVVPQAVIGRFFALFRLVGLVAGIVFNFYLMGKADEYYRSLLIVLAALYGAGFTLMCLNVKEGQYPPPPPPSDVTHGWLSPLISYLKECFTHPYYLWFFVATTLGNLAIAPVNTFSIFHAHSVNMSDSLYGKCLALSYVFSLVLSYPLGMLADRFHPLRLGIACMALYAAVTTFGFFTALTAHTFFIALALHTVISGCYITGTASIAQRLLPRARFAELCSAAGIVGAVIYMIVPPALGAFIQWMNHDYRYVFLLGSVTAITTCGCYAILLSKFCALGGDKSYVPPL